MLTSLKLLHPLLPFMTEELYQRLPLLPKERRKESIMVDSYPQAIEWNGFLNPDLESSVAAALEVVAAVRRVRSTYSLGPGARPTLLLSTKQADLGQMGDVITRLARWGHQTPGHLTSGHLTPGHLTPGLLEPGHLVTWPHVTSHLAGAAT